MKAFYRKTIALCLSMVVLFLTIGSAAAENVTSVVEIRGPVYNGSNIINIVGECTTIDATQFADFYYDIDDNVTTETLMITRIGTAEFNIIGIGEGICKGTYYIETGMFYFTGTSTTKGDFTGTYNTNTKEGTITYTGLQISEEFTCPPVSQDFTATYDPITKTLTISIVEYNMDEYKYNIIE